MRNNEGFTLLETLIAMAIMLVAFTAIYSVQSASINATTRARQVNIVAMLAKNKMVELEHAFEGKTFDEFKKKDAGGFETPYEDYRWETEIKEIEFPDLNLGKTPGQGGDEGGKGGDGDNPDSGMVEQLTKLVTNHLSKAVREATVTVYWKKGTGEQSFSVSTYWVDLNREFQLSL